MIARSVMAAVAVTFGLYFVPGNGVPPHHARHVALVTTATIPPALSKWDTTTKDSTASWPDKSDPMTMQPLAVQEKFACIRYYESRNHLVDTNRVSGAEGWYQFMPPEWRYARSIMRFLPPTPNQASGSEQSMVALFYYYRNGGLYPEWQDYC